jgi:predicted permease
VISDQAFILEKKMLGAYLNILVFFTMILIGYLLTQKKWFNAVVADSFSKLILKITLPAGMFVTITSSFDKQEFLDLFSGMLIPFFSILLACLLGVILSKVTKIERSQQGAFSTMIATSNTIFMGLPINMAIFGGKAVPYVLLYYICNTLFFWTIGVYLLEKDGEVISRGGEVSLEVKFNLKATIQKVFSPALMGFILGVICVFINFPKISFIEKIGSQLGELTTPLSMFFLGIIIYQTGIRNLKMTKEVLLVLIGRFLVSPLLVIGLSKIIPTPDLMLKVFIIQSAMPVQNSTTILAHHYGADEKFAASTLTYSVLVYLFIIPILLWVVL